MVPLQNTLLPQLHIGSSVFSSFRYISGRPRLEPPEEPSSQNFGCQLRTQNAYLLPLVSLGVTRRSHRVLYPANMGVAAALEFF